MGLPRPSKLDPFRAYIQEGVRQAHPDWIPASVLCREISERGYYWLATCDKQLKSPNFCATTLPAFAALLPVCSSGWLGLVEKGGWRGRRSRFRS